VFRDAQRIGGGTQGELGTATTAVLLPVGPFLQQSGGDWVLVLDDDSVAHRRRVRVGRRNIEQLEVLGGLTPGKRVITSDYTGYNGIDRIDIQ